VGGQKWLAKQPRGGEKKKPASKKETSTLWGEGAGIAGKKTVQSYLNK